MNEHAVLLGVRGLLQERGWGQYSTCSATTGRYCLEGAISQVCYGHPHEHVFDPFSVKGYRVWNLLAELLNLDKNTQDLAGWNDDIGRTKEEVMELLEAAIDITAGLTGPSKTITVEPIETPATEPREAPEPEPERTPEREPEKVPAGA